MKPSSAKAKGRNAENRWVQWLIDNGWRYAERRRLTGIIDRGDITGTPGITWEVKNHRTYQFPEWMRELAEEQDANQDPIGVLVVKPNGVTDPNRFWCVLTPETLAILLKEAGYGVHK